MSKKVEVDVDNLKILKRWRHSISDPSFYMAVDNLIACIPKRTIITQLGFEKAGSVYHTRMTLQAILLNVIACGGTLPEGWTEQVDG